MDARTFVLALSLFATVFLDGFEKSEAQAAQPTGALNGLNPLALLTGGGLGNIAPSLFGGQSSDSLLQNPLASLLGSDQSAQSNLVKRSQDSANQASAPVQSGLIEFGQSVKQIVDRSPNFVPDVKNLIGKLTGNGAQQGQQTGSTFPIPGMQSGGYPGNSAPLFNANPPAGAFDPSPLKGSI